MPEHFRALIVILFVASVVFVMARKPALDIIPPADFKRRRNLWFGLTLLAFFSHSFWLYAAATAVILYVVRRREHNVLALRQTFCNVFNNRLEALLYNQIGII